MASPGACGDDDEAPTAAVERTPADTVPTAPPETATAPPTLPSAPPPTSTRAPKRRERAESAEGRAERPHDARRRPGSSPSATPSPTATEISPQEPEPAHTTPERQPPRSGSEPSERRIEETATLELVRREGLTYYQQGRVEGTFSGTMELRATIGGPGVLAVFTVTLPEGTIRGKGSAAIRPAGSVVHFNGTASVTSGTGAFAKASAVDLRYAGKGAADGSTATVRLTGRVSY
jgi:hypothetical protein